MTSRKYLKLVFCILILLIGQKAEAQLWHKSPEWIAMMNDPQVNYFEAIEAFETYWSKHEKPMNEGEFFNDPKAKSSKSKRKKKVKYAEEYKKFIKWQQEMLPFVQDDGRILSPEERLEIWNKEKNARQ